MIASISYASLFPGDTATGGSDLLSTLYGSAAGASGGDPLFALKLAQVNQTRDVAATARQPQVARDIAGFTAALAKARTPADLLHNPIALKVLLMANGLGDQAAYPALAQKVLMSNIKDKKSLVNHLASAAWTNIVKTFDFANTGLATLRKAGVAAIVTGGYAEVSWRRSLDAATPGLSNALTFRAGAAKVTSVDQILGDSVLRDVVTTALGIPREIAFQSLGTQEKAISARLDVAKLKDAHFVAILTDRYLLAKQASGTAATAPSLDQLAQQAAGLLV